MQLADEVTPHPLYQLVNVTPETTEDGTAIDRAMGVIRELLDDGPALTDDVEEQARAVGIKKRTLERARSKLGVKARKAKGKFTGQWVVYLPHPGQKEILLPGEKEAAGE